MTLRVLSLATLYPNAATPRLGNFVARSLDAFARRDGCEVTVINPIGVPPLALGRYAALQSAAVNEPDRPAPVHRPTYRLIPKVGGRLNPGAIVRAVLPLARRLHAERPFDIVDAQFFWPDGPAAAEIAAALNLPLSIKARGADIHFWGGKPYARQAMLAAADRASGLLAVCGALADDMAALGMARDKVTVHYTGLDRDRFRPLQHTQLRNRIGSELGIVLPDDAPVLATVGALIPRKGQALVLRAMATIPGAHLMLVGKGEDEAALRALSTELGLANRVHFLGSVDHDLLPLILSAADVMVLPSASEGLANAWVEALACGTPLVITAAGGAREVVTGRDAGLIVDRDPEAIRAGIANLLSDPPDRHATAAMAERFDWRTHAEALEAHYRGLLR